MFVYLITKAPLVPMRWLVRLGYHFLLYVRLKKFQRDLSQKLGQDVSLRITYGKYYPAVALTVSAYPVVEDWIPQFIFGFNRDRRGVLLHYLTFPAELRYHRFGTFCIDWIKQLATQLGFCYLVLGAYPESEGFWLKMGFSPVSLNEWYKYWY